MKVLTLLGPTASGKTSLSIELAKRTDIEIISVDSAMIYKGLDIGTGKPSKDTLEQVPHRLVDILDAKESYSVGDFVKDVNFHIKDIHNHGKVPLLVGGTMMYFNALFNGIADIPASNYEIRKKLEAKLKKDGLGKLYIELKEIDPIAGGKINHNDPHRILRALEVYYISGKKISDFQSENKSILKDYEIHNIVISPESREEIHRNISIRFEQMIKDGFIDEVEMLYNRRDLSLSNSSIRSVGYKQVWQYLENQIDFNEMKSQALVATRQLAKRQVTWIRKLEKQFHFDTVFTNDLDVFNKALKIYNL